MFLLAGSMTHVQSVTLTLLCVFLLVFIIADVYLLFLLRRGNRRLEQEKKLKQKREAEGTSTENKDKDQAEIQ